ncbi:MAG: hypothetical protein Q8M76_01130, partial [Spirochaetaceae bacterium]|nr:hypothetical protein [Spirochaetaceae bacterium]
MRKTILLLALALLAASALSAETINVLMWDDAYPRSLLTMLPEFEKATGHKVYIEIIQQAKVFTKTSIAVTKTSTDYDLVCVDEGNIPLFASLFETYDKWPTGKVFPKLDPQTVTPA